MKDLLDIIELNQNLRFRLDEFSAENKNKISTLCEKCRRNFDALSKVSDIMRLAVCIEYAKRYTYDFYKETGISEEIFYSTMQDIAIWCENNNNKGLKNYHWIKNHLNGELFKIGRLQYQLYPCKNKTLDYKNLPFDYGDNLIYIHISQGERLIYSDCTRSLAQADMFFKKYFPDFEYQFYFCESWLLFNENFAFMDTSSNILQFQSLFEIVYSDTDDRQAIERIFKRRRLFKSNYPENTTLQCNAKKYMLDGNKLGIGIGIIDRYDIL